MKHILLFGAGKSSTALIAYLLQHASAENWELTVADANKLAIEEKIAGSARGKAVAFDINLSAEREALIQQADIVISLLPPFTAFPRGKRLPVLQKEFIDSILCGRSTQGTKRSRRTGRTSFPLRNGS